MPFIGQRGAIYGYSVSDPVAKSKKTPLQTAEAKADLWVGRWVRGEGKCIAEGWPDAPEGDGVFQAAHAINRSQTTYMRFSPLNYGGCLYRSRHVWFTRRPEEWVRFLDQRFPGRLDRLRAMRRFEGKLKNILDRAELNLRYAKTAADAIAAGVGYIDFIEGYLDPIEDAMKEFG